MLKSVWMTLISFKVTVVWKAKTTLPLFSEISQSLFFLMKFSLLPVPASLLKPMLDIFCISNIQGRQLSYVILLNIHITKSCVGKLVNRFVKLGMMQDTTKLCDLIPVWDLDVHSRSQDHIKARTSAVILLSCVKQLKRLWWLIM